VGDDVERPASDQVPLFHCFGCVMSSLNCIVHGSTMVMVDISIP
jgi:fatty-acyl-CoA synthase